MMSHKYKFLFSLCFFMVGLFACSGGGSSRSYTSSYAKKAQSLRQNGEDNGRVILKNASITMAVDEPDSMLNIAEQIAKQYGGYISGSRMEYAALQVKSEHLEAALRELSKLGKIKSKSINTQDVTEEYTDFKIRLENAEKARDRYQELLKKAEKVEEILPIEKELQRVTEDIERLSARIELIEKQQVLSRIDFYWHKRVKPGPIGYIFVGAYKAIRVLFVRK